MDIKQDMFDAKLNEMAKEYDILLQRVKTIQNADPDEVHKTRAYLEAEWSDTIIDLKNRAKMMRFLTAQQLSQVQLDYCRKAADILHDSLKESWSAISAGNKSDDTALYAEYTLDFATLAMRYALLSVTSAIDMQNEEVKEKGKVGE